MRKNIILEIAQIYGVELKEVFKIQHKDEAKTPDVDYCFTYYGLNIVLNNRIIGIATANILRELLIGDSEVVKNAKSTFADN